MEGERLESHQMLLPAELQPVVLKVLHNQAGHQGHVETECRKCKRCTVAKAPLPTIQPAMGRLHAERSLDILVVDLTTLKQATDGWENVLVTSDVFS